MELSRAQSLVILAEEVAEHVLGEDGAAWAGRLDAEAARLHDAADVLLEVGQQAEALRLVGSLSRWAQTSGRVDETRHLVEHVLSRTAEALPSRELASAWLAAGELAFRQADQSAAREATERALAIATEQGETTVGARSEMNLARIAFRDADADRILLHANRMLDLAGADPAIRAGAVHMLAWGEYTAGNVSGAIARFEENVELYRAAGNLAGVAAELGNLGDLALESGDVRRAAGFLARSLEIAASRDDRYLLPSLLSSVADLAGRLGLHEDAIVLTAASRRHYELAGLTPDPGDWPGEGVRSTPADAVGTERARTLTAEGTALSTSGAVERARRVLGAGF